jgi:hypothetical protein
MTSSMASSADVPPVISPRTHRLPFLAVSSRLAMIAVGGWLVVYVLNLDLTALFLILAAGITAFGILAIAVFKWRVVARIA